MSAASFPSRPRQTGPRKKTFAIVASQYNAEYVNGLVNHARKELEAIASTFQVTVYEVPGAFEIPVVAQELAMRQAADVIIALGVIIEGATQHAALIGQTITGALMQIALAQRIPVVHEVLLVKDEEQARVRCLGEDINRGTEAARVAARMAQIMGEVRNER